jgi:hypothetical protein
LQSEIIRKVMEKTFGKISAEERRRALEGERIDHHLTEYECEVLGYSPEFLHKFNKYATPRSLRLLYLRRKDDELSKFYLSIIMPYKRIPEDGVDCIFIEDYA